MKEIDNILWKTKTGTRILCRALSDYLGTGPRNMGYRCYHEWKQFFSCAGRAPCPGATLEHHFGSLRWIQDGTRNFVGSTNKNSVKRLIYTYVYMYTCIHVYVHMRIHIRPGIVLCRAGYTQGFVFSGPTVYTVYKIRVL